MGLGFENQSFSDHLPKILRSQNRKTKRKKGKHVDSIEQLSNEEFQFWRWPKVYRRDLRVYQMAESSGFEKSWINCSGVEILAKEKFRRRHRYPNYMPLNISIFKGMLCVNGWWIRRSLPDDWSLSSGVRTFWHCILRSLPCFGNSKNKAEICSLHLLQSRVRGNTEHQHRVVKKEPWIWLRGPKQWEYRYS